MNTTDELIAFARTKLFEADMAPAQLRHAVYLEAQDALIKAETIKAGSGAFLMACVKAAQKEYALAVRWLDRAAKEGVLPPPETIASDGYLAGMPGVERLLKQEKIMKKKK